MPVNGHTLGSDVTIDVYDPLSGGLLTIGGVTSFEPRQMTDSSQRRRMGGTVHPIVIPGGWEGTIGFDRTDNEIDRLFAAQEEAYYAGRTVQAGSITETINNPDQSVSQYRYEEVMFRFETVGRRSGEAVIEGSIGWQASRRRQVI